MIDRRVGAARGRQQFPHERFVEQFDGEFRFDATPQGRTVQQQYGAGFKALCFQLAGHFEGDHATE